MNVKLLIILFFLIITIFSCKEDKTQEGKVPYSEVKSENKEELININQDILKVNRDVILKYIERHNWNMTETKTGLYYMVYHKTDDKLIKTGDNVVFAYKISLMNGDVLYSSEENGTREILIDKNQDESGLNEGMKLLHKGEKAYFILPPHLAYGVSGDSFKVKPYSILVYDVEILDIKCENIDSIKSQVVL